MDDVQKTVGWKNPKYTPVDILPTGKYSAWFWFITFAILSIIFLLQPYWLKKEFRKKAYCTIKDASDMCHTAPLVFYNDIDSIYIMHGSYAVKAFLNRDDLGTQHPELLHQLFSKYAIDYMKSQWSLEEKEFKRQNLVQDIKTVDIKVLAKDEYKCAVELNGVVTRTGNYKGQQLTCSDIAFTIVIILSETPNLYNSGRLPFTVTHIKVKRWDTI